MRLDHLLSMETVRADLQDRSSTRSQMRTNQGRDVYWHVFMEFVVQLSGFNNLMEKKAKPENGGVAQLGEHLPCKQGVMGSNPIISTIF